MNDDKEDEVAHSVHALRLRHTAASNRLNRNLKVLVCDTKKARPTFVGMIIYNTLPARDVREFS
jgi:hypothetical protein